MIAALLSTGVALLLACAGLAALGLLTLAPFVVAVGLAERRGYGSVRWGAASVLCSLVGLGCVAVALRAGLGLGAAALAAAATWAAPVALLLLGGARGRLAGERGRHE